MAHNFKLTGNYYVSKDGSDANNGTSPDTPKLTLQAGINLIGNNQVLIVGAGVYKESITRVHTADYTHTIIADGKVVCEGVDGTDEFELGTSTNGQDGRDNIYGIEFRNYRAVKFRSGGTGTEDAFLYNCIIKCNCNIQSGSGITEMISINSIFINSAISSSSTSRATYTNSILINSSNNDQLHSRNFYGNYVDPSSVVFVNTSSPLTIDYNNVQGALAANTATTINTNTYQDILGNYYDLTLASGGTGTLGDPYGRAETINTPFNISVFKILYPVHNTKSFSANPLFNDPENLDFTLQPTSPNINASANFLDNIGGTEVAVHIASDDAELDTNATVSNLTLTGGAYTITSGTSGYVISAPIFLQWPIVKPLISLNFIGGLEFNKSVTAGGVGNNNVPAYTTYLNGSGAGARPDRLKIKMRFSTQQAEPTLASHWDNGGYWTAGNYETFELNTKPKVDHNGKGNGDPAYIEFSGLGDILASWVQVDILLRDDYSAT